MGIFSIHKRNLNYNIKDKIKLLYFILNLTSLKKHFFHTTAVEWNKLDLNF